MNLASQPAIALSAWVRFTRANIRALSTRVLPWDMASWWAIWFHREALGVTGPAMNRADSVWSGVRVVLSKEPSSLTWLKAAVYSGLVSAGGGGERNCEALFSVKGVTKPHCAAAAGKKAGGVGCQSPGLVPGV